jgi:hypothetical protein
MGGTHEHLPTVPLCRRDHDALHNGDWSLSIDDEGWATGTNADGTTFERPLYFDDASPSPAWWTDGKLGEQWERADAATLRARATIAHVYKRRWGWGRGWARRAADAMGGGSQGTGQQISERTIQRAANVWKHWEGNWELMKALGSMTVAYAVAGAEDTDRALEIAQKRLADGKKAGEIVAEIEGRNDTVGVTERCTCPTCGHEHNRKGE